MHNSKFTVVVNIKTRAYIIILLWVLWSIKPVWRFKVLILNAIRREPHHVFVCLKYEYYENILTNTSKIITICTSL